MSWTLFGQLIALLILVWMMIPTIYASVVDKRYADDLRRKEAGL